MKVTTRYAKLVKPAQETPEKIIPISNVDSVVPRIHTATVYFYQPNPEVGCQHDPFPFQLMESSLARALVPFYPLAGRLQEDERGRIQINCTGGGALLVEATIDAFVSDFGDFAPTMALRQLLPTVVYTEDVSSYPLLVVQVTFFRCGGVSVGVGMQHHVVDGMSALHFMNSWATMARGGDLEVKPYIDRSLLMARRPPTPKFAHIEYQPPPPLLPETTTVLKDYNGGENKSYQNGGSLETLNGLSKDHPARPQKGSHENVEHDECLEHGDPINQPHNQNHGFDCLDEKHRVSNGLQSNGYPHAKFVDVAAPAIVHLSKQQVRDLRVKAADKKTGIMYTTYETVAAHVWRCVSMARKLRNEQETKLHIATDGRLRLQPPLPVGYFGNVVFTATPMARAGDLNREDLSDGAARIRKALERMDDDYLRSALDYLEVQPDLEALRKGPHTFGTPNLGVISWTRLPIHDADFGWGRPIFMGPAGIPFEGQAFILPSPFKDGSLSVSLVLAPLHMPAFLDLFYKF